MAGGATTDPGRLVHRLVVHNGLEDLLSLVGPAVHAAVGRGAPVLVAGAPEVARAVRERFGDSVLALPPGDRDRRPVAELAELRRALSEHRGTERACFVTQPPVRTGSWADLRRMEAAVSLLLDDRPLDYLCAYERRSLSGDMLGQLVASHPDHARVTGSAPDDELVLTSLLRGWFDSPPDGIERTAPVVSLVDAHPVDARRAIRTTCADAGIDLDAMVIAVSEIVANAWSHGTPPVTFRLWMDAARVVATVTDRGTGPTDPFHGLRPQPGPGGVGGLGVWIAHRMVDTEQRRGPDGYTVVLSLDRVPVAI